MSKLKPTRFPNGIEAPLLNEDGEQEGPIADAAGDAEDKLNELLAALRSLKIIAEE